MTQTYFVHPFIESGFNFDEINGHEINGPGHSEPIYTTAWDSQEVPEPWITQEDLWGGVDITMRPRNRHVTVPRRRRIVSAGGRP